MQKRFQPISHVLRGALFSLQDAFSSNKYKEFAEMCYVYPTQSKGVFEEGFSVRKGNLLDKILQALEVSRSSPASFIL